MRVVLCAVLLLMQGVISAAAEQRFLLVSGITTPPWGWTDFCKHKPEGCRPHERISQVIPWTRENMITLAWVNAEVNKSIYPMADEVQWGVIDRWAYPINGFGDCEDYVLEKRRKLIAMGFPASALPITIVKELDGGVHAVLMVRTDDGEYIADNQQEGLLRWNETPYSYVKRQSADDPNLWVQLVPPAPPDVGAQVAAAK